MSAKRGELGGNDGAFFGHVPSIVAAAHELKSPLALVRQLALALEDKDLSENEKNEIISQINLTAEKALRLTSNLTRASRLDDAMFKLEPINPYQLCKDIVYELAPLFRSRGSSLNLANRKHPLLLVANRDLLRRIIMNFSDNALNYSGKEKAVQIEIKALNGGKTVRLGVRDYGPALSSDLWKTLRDKLDKAPQAVHARPQSSGLGLYIASQFADAMNGRIGVIRHRNGATFFIDLQASSQLSLL